MINEKLSEKYKEMFDSKIIYRGKEYFTQNKVEELYKDENKYIAVVSGSNIETYYNVEVRVEDDKIKACCTCPFENNCKHEYATLLAIDNCEYKEVKFLPVQEKEKIDFKQLITSIPEEKLKKYIVNAFKNGYYITKDIIIEEFTNYLPEKNREYFYNTLYNDFIIEKVSKKLDYFVTLAKKSVKNKNYKYIFTIVSAIIDATKESEFEDTDEYILKKYGQLEILIRIAYIKGNENLKEEIDKWICDLEEKDFYDDIYLEDMIIKIKKFKS